MLKPKNILIFIAAGVALVLIYVFFIKSAPEQDSLVSTSGEPVTPSTNNTNQSALDTKDFLTVLLSVKNIKLDASIFSDGAFTTLHDSNVVLTPDGTEGRPNPFAPIGSDPATPANTTLNNNQTTQPTPATFAPTPKTPATPTSSTPAAIPTSGPIINL